MKYTYTEDTPDNGPCTGLNREPIEGEKGGVANWQQVGKWGLDNSKYWVVGGVLTPLSESEVENLEPVSHDVRTVNRYQINRYLESIGKYSELLTLLAANPVYAHEWYSSNEFSVDNPMLLAAAPELGIIDIQAAFNEISKFN